MKPVQPITLTSPELTAVVDVQGAELHSLRTASGVELLWQGSAASWPDHAPVLFPVIGQLVGGLFRHAGKEYPMPAHGFARHTRFQVTEQTKDRLVLELTDNDETHAAYPFVFSLRAEFELNGPTFTLSLVLENRDKLPIFADVGWHPGFNWPLEPELSKSDYSVTFAYPEPGPIRRGVSDPIMLLPDPHPSPIEGRILQPTDDLFKEGPIVWDTPNSPSVTFGAAGKLGLQIDFPDSPSLGLWMIPGEPFLVIEPWKGYPSAPDFTGPFQDKPETSRIFPEALDAWRFGVTVLPVTPE